MFKPSNTFFPQQRNNARSGKKVLKIALPLLSLLSVLALADKLQGPWMHNGLISSTLLSAALLVLAAGPLLWLASKVVQKGLGLLRYAYEKLELQRYRELSWEKDRNDDRLQRLRKARPASSAVMAKLQDRRIGV